MWSPTLQQLLKALKALENWFVFGVILGVPVPQLKKIEYNQKDSERCKIEMLQYWLETNLVPTWNEVVQALEQSDQLVLAAQVKHDYLLSTTADSKEEGTDTPSLDMSASLSETSVLPPRDSSGVPISSSLPPMTSSAPVLSSSSPTPPPPPLAATDEVTAEIKADVAVVSSLKELEGSFGYLLVQVKRLLVQSKCDLSDALLFLDSVIGSEEFIGCDSFGKLMRQLQRDHIDVFNISILQQLVTCFDNHELTEVIEAYNMKKESFLKHTTVLNFQRAVVSRVEPILASGMAVVTIKVPKKIARHCDRTLKDIEELAMEGFEECHKKFIRLHAEPGSIIISWVFPKGLSGRLEQLVHDNAAIFNDSGVMEVTVGGRRVFPQEKVFPIISSQDVRDTEEKSKLKQLYIEFYQQLVEAVSDPDTCRSLSTQLHSTSLLSEKKKAALSSSLARGSSFLKVLGVEEEPHLLTVLVEKMSAVKQLQTLSEDMSGWLSGSKQEAADPFTEKQMHYVKIERQQLKADVDRLTSDKANLLTRLQCYEEDLEKSYELLSMREKAISGMMATVNRRDTDVDDKEEIISRLKTEVDELKRKEVESEEKASLLRIKIEALNGKILTMANKLLSKRHKSLKKLESLKITNPHQIPYSSSQPTSRNPALSQPIQTTPPQEISRSPSLPDLTMTKKTARH